LVAKHTKHFTTKQQDTENPDKPGKTNAPKPISQNRHQITVEDGRGEDKRFRECSGSIAHYGYHYAGHQQQESEKHFLLCYWSEDKTYDIGHYCVFKLFRLQRYKKMFRV